MKPVKIKIIIEAEDSNCEYKSIVPDEVATRIIDIASNWKDLFHANFNEVEKYIQYIKENKQP